MLCGFVKRKFCVSVFCMPVCKKISWLLKKTPQFIFIIFEVSQIEF